MLIDYHMHFMSHDVERKFKPIDYVSAAKKKDLSEIGFSEHFAVKKAGNIDYSIDYKELRGYVEAIQKLKKISNFSVKLGLEMDYFVGLEKSIKRVIKLYPFDYIIGTVHFIRGWPIDDPKSIPDYKKSDITKLYEQYFHLIRQAAKSRLFDIIGHVDIIKIFGFRPKCDITDVLKNAVDILNQSRACVEVNTRGLSKPCKEIYPSEKLLKICFDKGVPIILGSDSHKPEEVGRYFDKAVKLVNSVGYKEIARFTKRKMELVEI